jgi:microcompartment protein CcmL/EutN
VTQVAELDSIGLVEVTSIAQGYVVEDAMLKAARVDLLLARTICSGKYLIVVGADVASVDAAVEAGAAAAGGTLIEKRVLAHVHPSVFPAVAGSVDLDPGSDRSLGVIETFSASSVIEVADAAAKAAQVTLLRVHLAMAIGGKGFVLLAGDVASVEAAVAAGSALAADEGILVGAGVIARPHPDLLREFV